MRDRQRTLGSVRQKLVALAGVVVGLGCGSAAIAADLEPTVGQPAGALVLNTLAKSTFDLSEMRGKVVLVNYWATWCAPCREEMPALSAFYRANHDLGLEIIGISVDQVKDRPAVIKAAAKLAYPTAMLTDISRNGLGEPEGVPLTWVVDANGIVRDKLVAADRELFDRLVVPLLPARGQ
jgi:thiol-disulfide isomerase/thioredoxin